MKFMLMMNTPRDGYTQYMSWPKEILEANVAFMTAFGKKLSESGELVGAEGLATPLQARLVRAGTDGKPITDGVFPESKEFLAGYWIVDVDGPERAYEIAAEASTAPGAPITSADGQAIEHLWIEVREVMGSHKDIK
ncbi:MAG TPA: YciI family protein [Thermoanaerobaculia bacterium]|nr:YciI family protein [Thermoanaerobaculia bacterium]